MTDTKTNLRVGFFCSRVGDVGEEGWIETRKQRNKEIKKAGASKRRLSLLSQQDFLVQFAKIPFCSFTTNSGRITGIAVDFPELSRISRVHSEVRG